MKNSWREKYVCIMLALSLECAMLLFFVKTQINSSARRRASLLDQFSSLLIWIMEEQCVIMKAGPCRYIIYILLFDSGGSNSSSKQETQNQQVYSFSFYPGSLYYVLKGPTSLFRRLMYCSVHRTQRSHCFPFTTPSYSPSPNRTVFPTFRYCFELKGLSVWSVLSWNASVFFFEQRKSCKQ